MKTEFTQEELDLIPKFRVKYLNQVKITQPDDEIKSIITEIWADLKYDAPEITIHDSPKACMEACPNAQDMNKYWSLWLMPYVAVYDYCKTIGLNMDDEKLTKLMRWTNSCPFILFDQMRVYASRNLVEHHYNDTMQLHNESGMSASFADSWGIYSIRGVGVDEQIVMRPETQTIEQIRSEENEEVRRIRIERYGWTRYFKEIGARPVDERDNDIEGTKEFLLKGDNMTVLLCICPSTGKEFTLEVPAETESCYEAQNWLSGGLAGRIISAS